jgi:hypothetical protein
MKALHLLLAASLIVPLALHAQGKDPLVLSSFEGDLSRQWGGVHIKLETEKAPAFVKEGDQSGRWSNLRTNGSSATRTTARMKKQILSN